MSVRVLQVLARSAGGIATHVDQIAAALHDGEELHVDVAGPPGLPIEIARLRHHLEISPGPLGHRSAVERLKVILQDGSYDVVHAHGLRAGIDAGRARRSATLLLTVHNLVRPEIAGRFRARLYRPAESLAVRKADHAFAVSREIADHLKHRAPDRASHIEVLYLGLTSEPHVSRPIADVRRDLDLSPEVPVVVAVARLAPQKALHVMVDAVAMVPEVRLLIVGEGPLAGELEKHAGEAGIGERVTFLGFRDDVHDIVAAADVFCLSSIWEGVPLAAQEAILLGRPVVATRVGGMSELISDGVSGRLVPPNDPGSLAAALREVALAPDRGAALARRARDHLLETFSTERMLARLREVYLRGVPT